MNEIIKELTVDLTRKSNIRAVFAKQFDSGTRKLLITLTNNGQKFIPPKGAVATVNIKRSDGESSGFAAKITDDSKIEVTLGAWALNTVGEVKCTVALYFDDNKRLSSPEITLDVGAELYTGDDIAKDEEYSLLTTLLSDCSAVLSDEIARKISENSRVDAEKLRQSNEDRRITAENARNLAESQRAYTENIRSSNEATRIANESQRKENESTRIGNENTRQSNEAERQKIIGSIYNTLDGIIEIQNSLQSGEVIVPNAYPVGSIYISTHSTSPAFFFGGTWEQLKSGFLASAGYEYTNASGENVSLIAGETGGEVEHTLTVDEMPVHGGHVNESATSNYYLPIGSLTSSSSYGNGWKNASGEAYPSYKNAGGGKAHNNMPPYLAVYMWKRTA